MNCMPPLGTNAHQSGTEIANSIRLAANATCLASLAGTNSTIRPVSSGQVSSSVMTQRP